MADQAVDSELEALRKNAWVAAVWVPLDGLEEWIDNPRDNDGTPVAEVAKSIERFGFVAPICVWESKRRLVAGHTRMKAIRQLWAKHGADWLSKGAPGPGLVPVRFHEFENQDEADAYAIADNKLNELAKWKMADLRGKVADWHARGVSLKGLGFDEKALQKMIKKHQRGNKPPVRIPAPVKLTTEVEVLHGDCLKLCKEIPDESIDAIVTDPPYGIGFMHKSGGDQNWDGAVPGKEWAEEMLRVAKPGAHLIAFAATRTLHRLTVALEDAGWEVKDTFHWGYFSGFPKGHDVGKAIDKLHGAVRDDDDYTGPNNLNQVYGKGMGGGLTTAKSAPVTEDAIRWDGYDVALKPAIEPAVLVRKPLRESSIARQVLVTGTGAMNIRGCRHLDGDPAWPGPQGKSGWESSRPNPDRPWQGPADLGGVFHTDGSRWPANLYICPKPSRAERERGCEQLEGQFTTNAAGPGGRLGSDGVKNIHPTVKPVRLFRHLVRLLTPYGGTLLEPFAGSGTTIIAGCLEGVGKVIAVELTAKYLPIIEARVDHVRRYPEEWEYTRPGEQGDGEAPPEDKKEGANSPT